MKDITFVTDVQGEIIGEQIRDRKFPWKERKVRGWRLAELYSLAGWEDYAERAVTCSTRLDFLTMEETGDTTLQWANFCHLRLCPICIARRAKKGAYQLSQILDKTQADHPDTMYIFLTLTVQNCTGDKLGDTLGRLTEAWARLMDHRHIKRAIRGWARFIEITRNGDRSNPWYGTYHPHIHAILAVEPGYFAQNSVYFITKDEWIERWQKALRVDYRPSVKVQATRAKGEMTAGRAAAEEANKYAVKDEDYIDPKLPDQEAADIVETYTKALHRRRLVAFGGWLKEAAQTLGTEDLEDGDLVHIDQDTIRADVADLIEEYHWHFGAGDYVLTDRRPNPLKIIREGKKDGSKAE